MAVEKFDIADPERTRDILQRYRIRTKKNLGQNFLVNPKVIDEIVTSADINDSDIVLEIGPGIGSLTEQLAKAADEVYAFELDGDLLPVLRNNLHQYGNIKLIQADFMKVDLEKFFTENDLQDKTVKVVANLPYYITTPILKKLLAAPVKLNRLVLMMQKEVAERLTANPGHRAYGSLSIAVQTKTNVEISNQVSKNSFIPRPKVDSSVVVFTANDPADYLQDAANYKKFMNVVKASFKQKRKSLWNNLVTLVGKKSKTQLQTVFDNMHWEHNVRAEQISISDFITLTQQIYTEVW